MSNRLRQRVSANDFKDDNPFIEDEVITIKRKLWDEMISYKHRVEDLEECQYVCENFQKELKRKNDVLNDKIDQLELSIKLLKRSCASAYQELNTKINDKLMYYSLPTARQCPVCVGEGRKIHHMTKKVDVCDVCLGKGSLTG